MTASSDDDHVEAPTPGEEAGDGAMDPRRGRTSRVIGWAMIIAGVAILVGMGWVGWKGFQAYRHLDAASRSVSQLQDELTDLTDFDRAAAEQSLSELQSGTAAARSATEDPVYGLAARLPWLGPNLAAVREVSSTVDSLAIDVMPSLFEVSSTLQADNLAPKNGAIDLAPIEQVSPLLQDAGRAVSSAENRLTAIDRSSLVQPVGDAVSTLTQKLQTAADVIEPGARIARLVPPMLGSEKPQTYLVVFQNLAEPRATGGIFGSFALIKADRGKITIVKQGASREMGYFDPPAVDLPPNQRELYSDLMARYAADVNFTPDFPTAAGIYREMYRIRNGVTVDGVLAVDPVALSYALKGAAPIDVGEGVVMTADNFVQILLSTAYQKFDGRDQERRDAFLADATATVFQDVMGGKARPQAIIDGARRAVGERRLLIYSAHPEVQADIAPTSVSGRLNADPATPSVGVFLNDGSASKLGYYLSNDVKLAPGACRADGRRELELTVDMTYDAPTEGLPSYVNGGRKPGEPYTLATNVLVFAPLGGGIVVGAERDGASIGTGTGQDLSRGVLQVTVEMKPQTKTQLSFTVLAPPGMAGGSALQWELTPMVTPWGTSVEPFGPCPLAAE